MEELKKINSTFTSYAEIEESFNSASVILLLKASLRDKKSIQNRLTYQKNKSMEELGSDPLTLLEKHLFTERLPNESIFLMSEYFVNEKKEQLISKEISSISYWIKRLSGDNNRKTIDFNEARRVPIERVVARYGIDISGNRNEELCLCPLLSHDDLCPSCSINTEKNLFHCFSCGSGGGVIELVKLNEGVDALGAAKILLDM